MKNNQKSIVKAGAIAAISLISVGTLSAATTSSKGGMTTTSDAQVNHVDDGLPMLAAGVQELSLSGSLNWENATRYNVGASYGRFITPNWMLGVDGGLRGVNSSKDFSVGVFAEYDLLTNTKWVPFARVNTGYSFYDKGDDGAYVGVDVGVKYFMRSNMAISLSMGGDWIVTGGGKSDGIAKQIDLGLKWYY